MARFRLARPAQVDVTNILAASVARWGVEARHRYASILATAMRAIAAEPDGPLTRVRADLFPGLRSFHVRYAAAGDPKAKVRQPVHVIYYRVAGPGVIEILRVLHERMDPSRHVDPSVGGS